MHPGYDDRDQAAFEAGGRLGPLLAVAAGGLILVFALWWSYFKHEPNVSRRRSLAAMIAWGYGHYFVFAAVAALGAGLQVAADTTHDATDLDAGRRGRRSRSRSPSISWHWPSCTAGARSPILAPIAITACLVVGAALAATWIGVPASRRRDGDPGERAAGDQHRDHRRLPA